MKKILAIVLLCSVAILESCVSKATSTEKTVLLTMQKTPCFGNCPVYDLTIYTNGYAEYNAKNFLPQTGRFGTELSKNEVRSIVQDLDDMNFCQMKKLYGVGVTDFPSSIITYMCNGEEKKVEAIMKYPESLLLFIMKLDGLTKSPKWQPLDFD